MALMTSPIDIYRTANELIKQHGEDAPIHAAMRANELLDVGLENQYEPLGNVRLGAAAGGVAGLGLGAKEYLDDQTNTVEHCLRSRG